MKRILLSLSAALFLALGVNAQEMNFESTTHDYGTIPQDIPASYEFVFKNSGTAPLIISEAQGSCGCTVPEYPKEPVMPGKTGKIKVTYNAKSLGQFKKSVTIKSNDPTTPSVELRIEGNVDGTATPDPAKN